MSSKSISQSKFPAHRPIFKTTYKTASPYLPWQNLYCRKILHNILTKECSRFLQFTKSGPCTSVCAWWFSIVRNLSFTKQRSRRPYSRHNRSKQRSHIYMYSLQNQLVWMYTDVTTSRLSHTHTTFRFCDNLCSHCRSAAVRMNKYSVTVLSLPSGSDLTLCNATTTSKATPLKAPTALFRTQL